MLLSEETREAVWIEFRDPILEVISPLPFLLLLLPLVSLSARAGPLTLLFVLTIYVTFFYLFVARALKEIRSIMEKRKEITPDTESEYEVATYWGRFIEVSREAWFDVGEPVDLELLSEKPDRPCFRFGVYAFWSLVLSGFAFWGTALGLAKLLTDGNFEHPIGSVIAFAPVFGDALPFAAFDLLGGFLPIFEGLSVQNQIFVGGVMLATGFIFLTGARHLTAIADEAHRWMICQLIDLNPVYRKEWVHVGLVLLFYVAVATFL